MGKKNAPAMKKYAPAKVESSFVKKGFGWPLTFGLAGLALIATFTATYLAMRSDRNFDRALRQEDSCEAGTCSGSFASPCGAAALLAEVPVPGLHLVCVEEGDQQNYAVTVFPNSRGGPGTINFALRKSANVHAALRAELELRQGIVNRTVNPWSMFTEVGDPINTDGALLQAATALVYEGGAFIWPGVRIGHKQRVQLEAGTASVWMETISMRPLVFSIDNFLKDAECEYIQTHAAPHMASSGVSLMDKDKGKQATEWRTSKTYFMASKGHAPLQTIDARVALLTRVPSSHQELVQVLRYGEHEKYDSHHDYFDPLLYAKDPTTLRMTRHGKANRMATVLWYLSSVQGGGETIFPQFNGLSPPQSMRQCEVGLKVSPKKGKVIMFYSLTPDGKGDKNSLHGACPVKGEDPKWAANKWVWSAPMTNYFETP